jgi:hypothetical protein
MYLPTATAYCYCLYFIPIHVGQLHFAPKTHTCGKTVKARKPPEVSPMYFLISFTRCSRSNLDEVGIVEIMVSRYLQL